jgi:hypothetical protein
MNEQRFPPLLSLNLHSHPDFMPVSDPDRQALDADSDLEK